MPAGADAPEDKLGGLASQVLFSTYKSVLRILIHRIHMFLGFLDPDPFVRGMDPDRALDPDPDPSIIKPK
jgi:hypothetical protein